MSLHDCVKCTGNYFHTVGIPSKDEKNVDYVPTVFWSGKTKSPMGKTVSILNQERVCCEDSNGSAINSQVDVNNAKGMIGSPCLATRCADTYYEHTGCPGDEELVVLDVEDDERDEDIEVGSPGDEELHVVLDVEDDDERDEDIHVEAGCPGDELVGVEDEETGSDEDTETGIEAGCPENELLGVEDEETANHESDEDTETASCLGDEVLGVEDEKTANHESDEDTERGIEASCLGDKVLGVEDEAIFFNERSPNRWQNNDEYLLTGSEEDEFDKENSENDTVSAYDVDAEILNAESNETSVHQGVCKH